MSNTHYTEARALLDATDPHTGTPLTAQLATVHALLAIATELRQLKDSLGEPPPKQTAKR